MPFEHSLWTVSTQPLAVPIGRLEREERLEDMIVAEPRILSSEWMLIGRQVRTTHGGEIDLLGIAPDGTLVVIELKRERTPRDVVAQALDYASWVERLEAPDLVEIYAAFRSGRSLADDFKARFGQPLDDEAVNEAHQVVIVAGRLDPATERIVAYLADRDVAINVLCFQVFEHDGQQFLSRAWLLDPATVQAQAAGAREHGEKEPWNGEYYVSFGAGGTRRWDEAVRYGFVSGGGGAWYSNTLSMLTPGDRVWVKVPGRGFAGVGQVTGSRMSAGEFTIDGKPALDVLEGNYHRDHRDDPERAEYFVPVKWLRTVSEDEAVQELGMFGNQNTVCKPRTPSWPTTVEQLKRRFGVT